MRIEANMFVKGEKVTIRAERQGGWRVNKSIIL